MEDEAFNELESRVFVNLEGKLGNIHIQSDLYKYISSVVKALDPAADKSTIDRIFKDAQKFEPVDSYLHRDDIEDIMVNNTQSIFVYESGQGSVKVQEKIADTDELDMFVRKLKMYTTTAVANRHIYDMHLPNGSRCNIVDTPVGPDVTIRNVKPTAYSIIDLINDGEISYNLAARFWLYAEGLGVRPANMLIGGMPGSGKTTMLNAMFSFFRPEARVVVIEDTYELNTTTQDNCVRLETNPEVSLEDLLKNTLRMRPDLIIIGEVRGIEAKDMMAAMSIGKVVMSTLHANSTRDIVTRLSHDPMKVPQDMITLIDALIVVSQLSQNNLKVRRITEVSEISGIDTKVLLSDLYKYDYKTRRGSDILPSVTYRDELSRSSGIMPADILAEEARRSRILQQLNKLGTRDLRSINEFSRAYYDNPDKALQGIGLNSSGNPV